MTHKLSPVSKYNVSVQDYVKVTTGADSSFGLKSLGRQPAPFTVFDKTRSYRQSKD